MVVRRHRDHAPEVEAHRCRGGAQVAQVAHAAVMAAERLPEWAAAGCPSRLVSRDLAGLPGEEVARVVDAGLTEVPPGTITVVALQ